MGRTWSLKSLVVLSLLVMSWAGCSSLFYTKRVYMMYRVKPGDTLSKIADRYNWSVNQLIAINRISNPNQLEVDELLRVPKIQLGTPERTKWVQEQESIREPLVETFVQRVKGSLAWPIRNGDGRITSGFGKRSGNFHEGIDIGAKKGIPVFSAQLGKVIYSGTGLSGYGKLLVIKHDGYLSVYAHNRRLFFKRGEWVRKGTKVAEVGDSGRARGTHLHFEIRVENEHGNYVAINPALLYY